MQRWQLSAGSQWSRQRTSVCMGSHQFVANSANAGNHQHGAGTHQVCWDGPGVSSSVSFWYTLFKLVVSFSVVG